MEDGQTGSQSKRALPQAALEKDVPDELKISTIISGIEVATVGEGASKVQLVSPIRKSEALDPNNRPPKFLAPKE